ncbi:MAG: hypothetical protein PHT80_08540 [Lentisphaeria bacterium]|nr:hypothetical protein [Lentisphaeria bacterium]
MQTENDILFIADDSDPSFGRSVLARPGVVNLPASASPAQLAMLTGCPRCVLLQVAAEARAQWLRELLRRKWPIACAWPENSATGASDDDSHWLTQLAAATRKRRLPACVLGAWRVLPALASLKEMMSGGCLGELYLRSWAWGKAAVPSRRQQWLANDVLSWLAADTTACSGLNIPRGSGSPGDDSIFERSLASLGTGEALCRIVGSAGQAVARLHLPDGAGCVESHLGSRRRRQEFAAVNGLELELTLLWRFASRELKAWPLLAMLNDDVR